MIRSQFSWKTGRYGILRNMTTQRQWSLYLVGRIERLKVELCQSLNNITPALKEILPYERSKSEELFSRVAVLVNNLHLLDYRRLSGLAGTCRRDTVSAHIWKCDARRQTRTDKTGVRVCVIYNEEERVRYWARVVRPMSDIWVCGVP